MKHTNRHDGFKNSNFKAMSKRKLKWVSRLRVDDVVKTCRNTIERIVWLSGDYITTVSGYNCSGYSCLEDPLPSQNMRFRRWVKLNKSIFHEMLYESQRDPYEG